MRIAIAALTCVLALGGAAGAGEAERLDIAPYPAAAPWKKVTDKQSAEVLYLEWIPAEQSVGAISDILTQQAFLKLKDYDASVFVGDFIRRMAAGCRDARINGPKAGVENGYKVAYGQVYCLDHKAAHEDVEIFVKAIGGRDALHLIQREFRRPTVPGRTAPPRS